MPYTPMTAATLNCPAIGCAAIRLAWFDIRFFYLEFVWEDSVAAMTHVENCSLETIGVVLLLTYLFTDWVPRLWAHAKKACQARIVAREMRALRLEIKRCDEEGWDDRLQYCVCYDTEDEGFTDSEEQSE